MIAFQIFDKLLFLDITLIKSYIASQFTINVNYFRYMYLFPNFHQSTLQLQIYTDTSL